MPNTIQYDPTRTTTLRGQYSREMRRRFYALRSLIIAAVAERDVFGLSTTMPMSFNAAALTTNALPEAQAWRFATSDEKIRSFNRWLSKEVEDGILEVDGTGKPWTAKYVNSAYRKGSVRSYSEAHKEEMAESPEFYSGRRTQFLESSFAQPERLSKLKLLYTRSYEDLKGITSAMSQKISRTIADGLGKGLNPRVIARALSKDVTGITRQRALTMARTEVIYAHAEGQLDSFEEMGVEDLTVMSEWGTAGDDRVCPKCSAMEGTVFTIDEARGLIPAHANCVLGYTRVLAPGALAMMKTQYTGEVLEFVTVGGRRFSVTPKHILLTKYGFARAEAVHKGLDLVVDTSLYGASETPDYDRDVSSIADAFKSASESSGVRSVRMPITPKDLHGDARSCDEEVDVVFSDGVLWNGLKAELGETSTNHTLPSCGGGLTASGLSALAESLVRVAHSSDSSMGRCRDALAFLLGCVFEALDIGFAAGAVSDTVVLQSFHDDRPASVEGLSKSLNRHAILKELQHALDIDWHAVLAGGTPYLASIFEKSRFDRVAFDSIVARNATNAPTLDGMQFDKVAVVERRHVTSLPVYDIQTMSTAYSIGGVIASNCRCSWRPANVGEQPKTKRYWTKAQKEQRIEKSLKAGLPKRTRSGEKVPQTIAEAKRRSTWSGKDVRVKKPPAGVDL